ncbi:MAG: restriction endonuclease subunit S [Thaumarchaeota archaeon]|nr:restriction endonuclease subunit S [Nitrososphaerota archaeon]
MPEKEYSPPDGWIRIDFGAIIQPSTSRIDPARAGKLNYIGLEHIESGKGRLNGLGIASEVRSTKTVFHEGDVLYGKLRPYLNKVCVPDFDGVCSTDILVFPRIPFLNNKYVSYRMLSEDFVRFANLNVSGVQHPRVDFKKLSRFDFPLPPLPEQHRIVEKIEELFSDLDAGVEALKKVKAELKRYRQAVLKAAVEGKLTEDVGPHLH